MPETAPEADDLEQQRTLDQRHVKDRQDIAGLLQHLSFPAAKQAILRDTPKIELIWTNVEPVFLDDVIAEIPQEEFDSLPDLIDAICSVIQLAFRDYSAVNQAPLFKS